MASRDLFLDDRPLRTRGSHIRRLIEKQIRKIYRGRRLKRFLDGLFRYSLHIEFLDVRWFPNTKDRERHTEAKNHRLELVKALGLRDMCEYTSHKWNSTFSVIPPIDTDFPSPAYLHEINQISPWLYVIFDLTPRRAHPEDGGYYTE